MKWVFLLLICIFLVSGCAQQGEQGEQTIQEQAKLKCIELCEAGKTELLNGPCLSDDNPEWNIDDWVCDVAHFPREAIDNLPENQCKEFREGIASHFVEVDPNCKFIKAV